jgi:hypothetical protein
MNPTNLQLAAMFFAVFTFAAGVMLAAVHAGGSK